MIPIREFVRRRASSSGLACVVALVVGSAWCWARSGTLNSLRDVHRMRVSQIEGMHEDVESILRLRRAPRIATDRRKPNDELLAQIADAAQAAEIAPDLWVSSHPMSASRIPGTPYQRMAVRVAFTGLSLREMARFCMTLIERDPTIGISALRVHAPQEAERTFWDVDAQIEYLVYTPISH